MFDSDPNDEANLKYEIALIVMLFTRDKPVSENMVKRKRKLEARLKDIQATREIMEAVYEGDNSV